MIDNFFQTSPLPSNVMIGTYVPQLVILSYIVAIFVSYITLNIIGRLRDPNNTVATQLFWILGGSIAVGTGIWSMHFISILSFNMPGQVMHYELFWTALSLLFSIFISAFALYLLKKQTINLKLLALGGVILGIGISLMHYTGMEAMKIDMNIHYLPKLFFLSILVAIVASIVALFLALKINQVIYKIRLCLKLVSAVIMGIAICDMHYVGMTAAVFTPKVSSPLHVKFTTIPSITAILILSAAAIILGIAFFVSVYKEALNRQQIEKTRQLGMAEISASVLHNVGNVLNSINVSSNLLIEKITNSKLKNLDSLSDLFEENKNDLGNFIVNDERGKKIPIFLRVLAQQRQEEHDSLLKESQILLVNLQHVKAIISMQQNMSRTTETEEVVSIASAIDEAILMTDIDFLRHGIFVQKQFNEINSTLVDKVNLLQILVNLLRNAKDSLMATNNKHKQITISLTLNNDHLAIFIADNGLGISPQQMKKIFIYGYTTKKEGYGYGLHGSILSARNMGGDLKVKSEGLGKGATFILELPYRSPNL